MDKSKLPKNAEELQSMGVGARMNAAQDIGEQVGKIMGQARKKANKFLQKYGYEVSVTLNFHELKKDEENR